MKELLDSLNLLYGAPAVVVVFVSAIAFGWLWKSVPFTNNRWIPHLVVLGSGIWLPLLTTRPPDQPFRIWLTRHFLIGVIVGLAAWLFHAKLLKKYETQIPIIGKLLTPEEEVTPVKPNELTK